MRKIFSTFGKLIFPEKKSKAEIESPNIKRKHNKTLRISDEFEISVQGMPSDLTATEQKQVFVSLLKNGLSLSKDRAYNKGDDIFQGKAALNIKDKVHQIEYSISAMKVLQALTVYKEAFDFVNQGAENGKFDPELAEMASDFLKESAWQEILGLNKPNQKGLETVKSIDKSKQLTTQKPDEEEHNHVNE